MTETTTPDATPIPIASLKLTPECLCKDHSLPKILYCHKCACAICESCLHSHSKHGPDLLSDMKDRLAVERTPGELGNEQKALQVSLASVGKLIAALTAAGEKLTRKEHELVKLRVDRIRREAGRCRLELSDTAEGLWRLAREHQKLQLAAEEKEKAVKDLTEKLKQDGGEQIYKRMTELQSLGVAKFAEMMDGKLKELEQRTKEYGQKRVLNSDFDELDEEGKEAWDMVQALKEESCLVAEKCKELDKTLEKERGGRKAYIDGVKAKLTQIKQMHAQLVETQKKTLLEGLLKPMQDYIAAVKLEAASPVAKAKSRRKAVVVGMKAKLEEVRQKCVAVLDAQKKTIQECGCEIKKASSCALKGWLDRRTTKFAAKETELKAQISQLKKSEDSTASSLAEIFGLMLPDFKGEKTAKTLSDTLTQGTTPLKRELDHDSWTLLMKAAGTDLCFSSPYWISSLLLLDDPSGFTGKSAKYATFCIMPVGELMIVCKSGERWTRLRLPQRRPLLEFFRDPCPTYLEHVSGAKDPVALLCGNTGMKFCEPVWRINGFSTTNSFRCRLGGYFCDAKGKCGEDGKGAACSKEMAGFGIEDNRWGKFEGAKKSVGVRCAGDAKGFGDGQCLAEAVIYGR